MAAVFEQQITQSFCGVATATMMLNAMDGSKPCTQPYAPYPWFTQCNVLAGEKARKAVSVQRISMMGMTLKQHRDLLVANGVRAVCAHAGEATKQPAKDSGKDEQGNGCEALIDAAAFRKQVQVVLGKPGWQLAVNFKRAVLADDGKGGGHFSPIAAYHGPTDSVLVMDVARYKYPPFWVPLELLFKAMATRDGDSGRHRGAVYAFPL